MEIFDGLVVTVAKRPYVFAFLAAYAFAATRHLGGRRVLALTAIGWLVAWSSEASSIRTGFPYGLYRYLVGPGGIDPREPRIAGVPLFDSISYVFLAYASYCVTLVILGVGARDLEGRRRVGVAVATAAIFCAVDTIVDPVALRGSRWFLGQIYDYPHGGAHFGVPVSNYAGWLLVGFLIVFLFQRADARLAAPRTAPRGGPVLGTLIYLGVVVMNVGIAFRIGETTLAIAACCTALPILGLVLGRAFAARV